MNKPPRPSIYYRLNIEILQIVEERVSAQLGVRRAIDPAQLASEIINDNLSKGFSWEELNEIIEVAAEEMGASVVRGRARASREH